MKRFYQVCLLLFFLGLIFIGLTPRTLAVSVSCELISSTILRCEAVCNNGPSNTNSGGCGTACMDLCDNFLFTGSDQNRETCRNVMQRTRPWGQYNARGTMTSSGFNGQEFTGRAFSFFRAADVCSTADKLTPGNLPRLRAGSCACGEGQVRGIYKVCCEREGSNWVPVNAVEYGTQDDFLPREGRCPTGSSVAWLEGPGQPLVAVRGPDGQLNCPGPPPAPTITLTANPTSITAPGPSSRLTWDSTNADSCRWIEGLIRPSTLVDGSADVWPTATTTYTIECTGNNRITTASATVTVGQRPPTTCPLETSFNIVHGPRPGDTTVTITPIPPTPAPPSSCRATCRRCSNLPSQIGNMATWTDDNFMNDLANARPGEIPRICDDGFNDVTFTPDPACACVANISASPTTVSPGGASTLTWSTERALATGCNISGIGLVSSQGNRSVTNIQSTTTYTITCNAVTGGGTCSRSVTVNVGLPPPPPPPIIVPVSPYPPSVSPVINLSVSPTCIPQQPGSRREAHLSWGVSIGNSCPSLPNNSHTFTPGSNSGQCGGGSGSWTSGWELISPSIPATCSAFGGWSGTRPLSGLHSISPPPSFTTTYGLSCRTTGEYTCQYRRHYTHERYECVDWDYKSSYCTTTIGGVSTTFYCGGWECSDHDCVTRGGSVSGSGPTFGPSLPSQATTTLAVIQPLNNVSLTSQRDRILYKSSTDVSWNSSAPSSDVSTEIRCTPSVLANGDGTNWAGAVNSLSAFGTRTVFPIRTTTYQLLCRNIYQNDRACYTYLSAPPLTIGVFTPDLREVPAFYDNLLRIVGMVRGIIIPALAGSQDL